MNVLDIQDIIFNKYPINYVVGETVVGYCIFGNSLANHFFEVVSIESRSVELKPLNSLLGLENNIILSKEKNNILSKDKVFSIQIFNDINQLKEVKSEIHKFLHLHSELKISMERLLVKNIDPKQLGFNDQTLMEHEVSKNIEVFENFIDDSKKDIFCPINYEYIMDELINLPISKTQYSLLSKIYVNDATKRNYVKISELVKKVESLNADRETKKENALLEYLIDDTSYLVTQLIEFVNPVNNKFELLFNGFKVEGRKESVIHGESLYNLLDNGALLNLHY